jgi:hypothetical protein
MRETNRFHSEVLDMTRLFVDQREIDIPQPAVSSLHTILKHVEEAHLQPNSVIRQIQIDGQPLLSENLENDPDCALGGAGADRRIDVVTGTLAEVAQESIAEAMDYLGRVETATPSLALGFRVTPGAETLEHLKQLYEGLYWLNILMDRLSVSFNISLEQLAVHESTAREHHQNMIAILKELISAHERKDNVLVADMLEYEIPPLVPKCRDVFTAMLGRISTGP